MLQAKLKENKTMFGCKPGELYLVEKVMFGYKIHLDMKEDNHLTLMPAKDFWDTFNVVHTLNGEPRYEIY